MSFNGLALLLSLCRFSHNFFYKSGRYEKMRRRNKNLRKDLRWKAELKMDLKKGPVIYAKDLPHFCDVMLKFRQKMLKRGCKNSMLQL